MRNLRRWTLLAVLASSVLFIQEARATTLNGKVIEINDGDEITILNLTRPVRIRLLGIDAPEKNQAFGDVARQHLSDLVFGKVVSVEYSGMDSHTIFIGRVLCNGVDISAQMIRDGAAWFAPQGSRLTDTDQQVYSESERAARSERRGLWQMDQPVAPWEFVKAENLKRKQEEVASRAANGQIELTEPVFRRPTQELTNLNLKSRGPSANATAQPSLTGGLSDLALTDIPYTNPWHRFQPEGENFSVLIPQGGKQFNIELPFGNQPVTAKGYVSRDGDTAYMLFWIKGPHQSESDASVVQLMINSIVRGTDCDGTSQRNVVLAGYYGKEIDLSACRPQATARVYTTVVGDQRELYFGAAMFKAPDENISKFLKSFTVVTHRREKQSEAQ